MCLHLVFAMLCMGGRKEQKRASLNSVGQSVLSLSDAPHQPLPFPYCLICNESSIQTESGEVCQSSLFRVKYFFFHLLSPTLLRVSVSLPPPASFFYDASNSNA